MKRKSVYSTLEITTTLPRWLLYYVQEWITWVAWFTGAEIYMVVKAGWHGEVQDGKP